MGGGGSGRGVEGGAKDLIFTTHFSNSQCMHFGQIVNQIDNLSKVAYTANRIL